MSTERVLPRVRLRLGSSGTRGEKIRNPPPESGRGLCAFYAIPAATRRRCHGRVVSGGIPGLNQKRGDFIDGLRHFARRPRVVLEKRSRSQDPRGGTRATAVALPPLHKASFYALRAMQDKTVDKPSYGRQEHAALQVFPKQRQIPTSYSCGAFSERSVELPSTFERSDTQPNGRSKWKPMSTDGKKNHQSISSTLATASVTSLSELTKSGSQREIRSQV